MRIWDPGGAILQLKCQPNLQQKHGGWEGELNLGIAFRHLPPNSARFSYITEGVFFISTQLSTDAVSPLQKVRVLIRLWKQPSTMFTYLVPKHTRKYEAHPPPGKKKSSISIETIVVLFELV